MNKNQYSSSLLIISHCAMRVLVGLVHMYRCMPTRICYAQGDTLRLNLSHPRPRPHALLARSKPPSPHDTARSLHNAQSSSFTILLFLSLRALSLSRNMILSLSLPIREKHEKLSLTVLSYNFQKPSSRSASYRLVPLVSAVKLVPKP